MTSPMRSPRGPQLSFARTTWRCWPLSHPVTVEVDGFGPVLFCHGTPRDDEEVVPGRHPTRAVAGGLRRATPEVTTVVCGHTHMPFVRLVARRLVVNAGSIGMPYGRPGGFLGAAAGTDASASTE